MKEESKTPVIKKISIHNITFEMIKVESGTFQMGGDDYYDERPIHEVQLSSFWLGKYPLFAIH